MRVRPNARILELWREGKKDQYGRSTRISVAKNVTCRLEPQATEFVSNDGSEQTLDATITIPASIWPALNDEVQVEFRGVASRYRITAASPALSVGGRVEWTECQAARVTELDVPTEADS